MLCHILAMIRGGSRVTMRGWVGEGSRWFTESHGGRSLGSWSQCRRIWVRKGPKCARRLLASVGEGWGAFFYVGFALWSASRERGKREGGRGTD
ncbi:hypothetical protein TIFTF001_035688 [Ficus carica]|uniref:Uncharacterized protein n=1 Tax=Ficus carica TaxID=3494 RepID=A0AA88J9X2_FICCA|nr:hypothetical protein TIFTF001_035688 [Ficus carica]